MATTTTLLPFFLFFFFFLLIASVSSAKSLRYQTLVLGPLQTPQTLDPSSIPDLSWTLDPSSSPSLTESEPFDSPPLSLTLHLHPLDSLLPLNTTATATATLSLLPRLRRDAARVLSLSSSPNTTSSFTSSIISGLSQGSGEYFTRIGVGTPVTYSYMVLDTGSDVVWLQCSPCRRCYPQSDPIYDPSRSRSFAPIPCFSPLCRLLDVSGCDIHRRSCLYQVSYGDGSATMGEFSTETLTFQGGARVGRVAFGCGHDNQGLFVAAAGLLGLGRGRLSFPSQAGRRFGNRFSYCLVDRTSSVSARNNKKPQSSTMVFGDAAVPDSGNATNAGVVYTPLLTNPRLNTFYYVELTGISVGGERVPGVELAADLRLDPATGRGGVIVDSGTSVTRLARAAYEAVRDAFKTGAAGLPGAEGFSLFDTCYDLSGRKEVKVPTVVLHFGRGGVGGAAADVSLPAENYLIPVDRKGVFCLALAGTDSGISIIGNIQQQGFRVVFDGKTGRVGFVPNSC